jgi:Mannitol dehydrogenase C-terminal domain
VPGIDLGQYTTTLLDRLANPKMADGLQRLCRRGSTKVPSYLLPSLAEAVKRHRPHSLLTLALAGWSRYLWGTDCAGDGIEIEDARRDELHSLVAGADSREIPLERSIFGELGEDETFAERLDETLRVLEECGPVVPPSAWCAAAATERAWHEPRAIFGCSGAADRGPEVSAERGQHLADAASANRGVEGTVGRDEAILLGQMPEDQLIGDEAAQIMVIGASPIAVACRIEPFRASWARMTGSTNLEMRSDASTASRSSVSLTAALAKRSAPPRRTPRVAWAGRRVSCQPPRR